MRRWSLLVLVGACAEVAPLPNTADWWPEGVDYDVQEPIRFTPEPYPDLPGDRPGVRALRDALLPSIELTYAPGDGYPPGSECEFRESAELPWELEGIVTLHPEWYMKLRGCNRAEEKYYGNWFIEDATSGIFVVGDSRVAPFTVGDRVKLKVRAVRTNFGMDMIYAYDVLEVHREARPVYYQAVNRRLEDRDIGETRRIRGVVQEAPDTFGDFRVRADGVTYHISLSAELNRRRFHPPVGQTLCVTGPVQFSFSTYSIPIMRIGQVALVDEDEPCPDEPAEGP
ncbi:MAG: hypothetical protein EA397_09750 [Deltaproteobacteria bacterium]|nr:MAG: hypothetical protein EA397_09750 [Deltaproteobacteria bacterium]